MMSIPHTIVAVGGFTSNTGKTTLMCELLRALPGWEAIKTTRGHYRSCGKDPHACCVSHLLGDEPVVRSGRAETYTAGKDTGRYWDAGASNVHWCISTDAQVGRGISRALARVRAAGVLVEGNSFQSFVGADFALMVARAVGGKVKPSARRALARASALYLSEEEVGDGGGAARREFKAWLEGQPHEVAGPLARVPVFTRAELPQLVARIEAAHASRLSLAVGGGVIAGGLR